jgi:hypothetical protein
VTVNVDVVELALDSGSEARVEQRLTVLFTKSEAFRYTPIDSTRPRSSSETQYESQPTQAISMGCSSQLCSSKTAKHPLHHHRRPRRTHGINRTHASAQKTSNRQGNLLREPLLHYRDLLSFKSQSVDRKSSSQYQCH